MAHTPALKGARLNLDAHPVPRVQGGEEGQAGEGAQPFRGLHVRARDQVVVDGGLEPLVWRDCGREVRRPCISLFLYNCS